MKKIKRINVNRLKNPLGENELKAIRGGVDEHCPTDWYCDDIRTCENAAGPGHCRYIPFGSCRCLAHS